MGRFGKIWGVKNNFRAVRGNMVKKTECKKIKILDMCVDNYTVRESLLRLDTYLASAMLNIIETVTMEQLILANDHPAVKDCLKQADLCIVGDCEILSETGHVTAQRMREIREQDFLCELLRRVTLNRKRVFLIASTDTELLQVQEVFTEWAPGFVASGVYAVETCTEDMDTIVNEINGAMPDIVISALKSPDEEEFLQSHKDKIGACVWYGIGAAFWQKSGVRHVGSALKKLALRGRLRLSMLKYGQTKNEDKK